MKSSTLIGVALVGLAVVAGGAYWYKTNVLDQKKNPNPLTPNPTPTPLPVASVKPAFNKSDVFYEPSNKPAFNKDYTIEPSNTLKDYTYATLEPVKSSSAYHQIIDAYVTEPSPVLIGQKLRSDWMYIDAVPSKERYAFEPISSKYRGEL